MSDASSEATTSCAEETAVSLSGDPEIDERFGRILRLGETTPAAPSNSEEKVMVCFGREPYYIPARVLTAAKKYHVRVPGGQYVLRWGPEGRLRSCNFKADKTEETAPPPTPATAASTRPPPPGTSATPMAAPADQAKRPRKKRKRPARAAPANTGPPPAALPPAARPPAAGRSRGPPPPKNGSEGGSLSVVWPSQKRWPTKR
ncbi:nascent polypeptide-associated complex subunit alpha, muscle-specific form-like [Colletes gigas]|uniref:nascent polypeptide-associated complex subunit alpha, muscle-specific form-like n=1 Tax=Colletes gigas TaxID=935657 RepID=UPI001C9B49C9|nr:nascent polypeptide-associated complex subunit alpha, muscle-specific form-like [Colletes gigas]